MPLLAHDTTTIADGFPYNGLIHRPTRDTYSPALYPRNGNERSNKSIRVLLLDADPITTSKVRGHLRTHDDFELLVDGSSGDIDGRIAEHQPDVLVVDVDLMESNGCDVAQLMNAAMRPVLVFITAHTSYALRAFDLGAADYLLKPLQEDRFAISLQRIREQLTHRRAARGFPSAAPPSRPLPELHPTSPRHITVTNRRRTHMIEPHDIEWIGAAGDYTELHVRGTTHLLREPLSVLLSRLPADAFCRIHRSSVVNLGKVSGLKTLRNQDLLVKLKDKTVLRASRTFSEKLKKAMTQHYGWRQTMALEH